MTISDLFEKKFMSLNIAIQSPNLLVTSTLLSAQSVNNIPQYIYIYISFFFSLELISFAPGLFMKNIRKIIFNYR